jgi:D-alanyl-D-alanine carboxypeptidase
MRIACCILTLVLCQACTPSHRPEVDAGVDAQRELRARARLTEHASGRGLAALVDAINAGDSAAIVRFGREHYDAKALAETGGYARLVNRWLEISESVGPLRIDTVVASSPAVSTVWLRGATSRSWLTVRLVADSVAPHGIQRISLGRGLRPPHADARVEGLTESDLPRAIASYMEGLSRADLFSGVVLLSGPRGRVFAGDYGFADRASRRRMTPETPFDIGSIGKTFTTIAIGKLADRGRLRLADSIGRHLPELPARLRRITIEQLLEHSSGLGELGPRLDSAMRRATTVSEMLAQLGDTTLAFAPGTDFTYSNRGYILLGAVVERAAGMAYAQFLATNLFGPAGMTRTTLGAAPLDRARRYTHYPTLRSAYTPGTRVEFDPRDDLAPGPHGGAYSTALDLERFAAALVAGRLADTSTVRMLAASREGHPWARGFQLGGSDRGFHFGHGGATPGMNALLRIFPRAGYTLVVLSNYDSGANVAGGYISELIEGAVRSRGR